MEGRGHDPDIKRWSGFEEVAKGGSDWQRELYEKHVHKVREGAWHMVVQDGRVESRRIRKEASLDWVVI